MQDWIVGISTSLMMLVILKILLKVTGNDKPKK